MNIKIILPTFYDEKGKLVKVKKGLIPNLTILYLAGMVPKHHSVAVVEESIKSIGFDESVDLVALSVNTVNAERSYQIAKEFRKRDVTVVMGGIHITCMPKEALQHADAVIIGEAEDSWPQLLRDFGNKRMHKIYKSPKRESLENLPHPRFELINHSKYIRIPSKRSPIIPIQTSRGCPHNCEFCSVTKFSGREIRYRPIDDITEEIKHSKADTFFFTDDNLFSNYARAKNLCRSLIPLRIKYICQMDTSIYRKPELVKLAAKSGCIMGYIGFESLKKKNLQQIKKSFNMPEEYGQLFKIFNKYGISIFASLIFGFDNDNPELVRNTVEFFIKKKASVCAFFPLAPFPGTVLYEKLKAQNRLVDNKWWLKESESPLTSVVRIKYSGWQFSGWELSKMAMQRFYSYPSIIRRFALPGKNKLFPLIMNCVIHARIKKSIASFM